MIVNLSMKDLNENALEDIARGLEDAEGACSISYKDGRYTVKYADLEVSFPETRVTRAIIKTALACDPNAGDEIPF